MPVLYSMDFENDLNGDPQGLVSGLTEAQGNLLFGFVNTGFEVGNRNASIIDDPSSPGNNIFEVFIEKGTYGYLKGASSRANQLEGTVIAGLESISTTGDNTIYAKNGGKLHWPDVEECWMTYRFKMNAGFDPIQGGKLWGLASHGSPGGGAVADGTNGYQARLMWKQCGATKGDGNRINTAGAGKFEMKVYLYDMVNPNQGSTGDHLYFKNLTTNNRLLFVDDTWYTVHMRIVMNTITAGVSDQNGIVECWVNGGAYTNLKCCDHHNRQFRAASQPLHGTTFVAASCFAGGNTSAFADPNNDRYIYVDSCLVQTESTLSSPLECETPKNFVVDQNLATEDAITISWGYNTPDANHDAVIERGTDGINFSQIATQVSTNVTPYVDSGLSSNTTYYYRMKTTDTTITILDSPYTAVRSASTITPTVLLAPSTPTASFVEPAQMQIDWTYWATLSDVEIVVEISTDDVIFTEIAAVNTLAGMSHLVTGLDAATTYYFRLYARSVSGSSIDSAVTASLTQATTSFSTYAGSSVEFSTNSGASWTPQISGVNTLDIDPVTILNNGLLVRVVSGACEKEFEASLPPPIASDESVTVSEATPFDIDVLNNDTGVQLTTSIVTPPIHGTAVVNPDYSIRYTGNSGFSGSDSFTYTVTDAVGNSSAAPATVSITIAPLGPGVSNIDLAYLGPDDIDLDFTGSSGPVGGTPKHRITFGLEDEDAFPTGVIEISEGSSFTQANIDMLESMGLFGLSGVFNGAILGLSKNPGAIPSLQYPILVRHSYDSTGTGGFGAESSVAIPRFSKFTSEDESKPVAQAGGAEFLPIWPVGGINFVSGPLTALYNSGRYRMNPVTTGSWTVISRLLPTDQAELQSLSDPLDMVTYSTLRGAVAGYVGGVIGLTVQFIEDTNYIDGVDRNVSMYITDNDWVPTFDFENQYFLTIREEATGEYFTQLWFIDQTRTR